MMPSYKTNDPKGWCGDPKRGAAMGRPSRHASDMGASHKLTLRHVPLDSGGYDKNGTYFGTGPNLYWCADESGEIDFVFRAHNREYAKERVRKDYPNARFYR